jgi:hypothetical protein
MRTILVTVAATAAFALPAERLEADGGGLDSLARGPGFAVVELFTSQGCSSCPPADRLLARLAEHADEEHLPIYALSMHVDYWNHLGWKDPFSQRGFSERQQRYARVLGEGVFTPQVVVNGEAEGLGSDEAELAGLIAEGFAAKPKARITLDVRRDGSSLEVDPRVEGAPDGARLWIAVTRRTSANGVERGENAGRELSHAHVVRVLESIPPSGTSRLELPPDLASDGGAVTAFLQDPTTMRILAATRVEIAPPTPPAAPREATRG